MAAKTTTTTTSTSTWEEEDGDTRTIRIASGAGAGAEAATVVVGRIPHRFRSQDRFQVRDLDRLDRPPADITVDYHRGRLPRLSRVAINRR